MLTRTMTHTHSQSSIIQRRNHLIPLGNTCSRKHHSRHVRQTDTPQPLGVRFPLSPTRLSFRHTVHTSLNSKCPYFVYKYSELAPPDE